MPDVWVLEEDHGLLVGLLLEAGVEAFGTDDPAALRPGEILLASPRLAAQVIDRPGLRWVQSTWAGVDALVAAGIPEGVVVTGLKGVFGTQMREYVLAHLLGHIQQVARREADRSWNEQAPGLLAGSTVGIMGTGSIGSAVAVSLDRLDVTVRGFNRSGAPAEGFSSVANDAATFADGLHHLVALLPSTDDTANLVDAELLDRLEPGAVFINAGRGSTVDTDAVVAALATGRLARAVLDVLRNEPLPDGDPLWDVPGLVITSHTAAWSRPEDVIGFFLENLRRWERGEPLAGLIDPARGY